MDSQEFIFSRQPKFRLARHLLFWIVLSLHFIIQNLMVGGAGEARTYRTFTESAVNLLYFLPIFVVSTSFFLEILLPNLLFRGKYLAFAGSVCILAAGVVLAAYFSGRLYFHREWRLPYDRVTVAMNKYHTLVNGLFVPLMIWGIGGGIKFAREWYERQRENEALVQRKIATEIKLLKTQIHPRFLFQTLGSVQQQIRSVAADAPALVLHLSDLLSYLLYESDQDSVALEKEIEVVRSYITLQLAADAPKRRVFNLGVNGVPGGRRIPPLLILTVAEKCFENFFDGNSGAPDGLLELSLREGELVLHLDCVACEEPGNGSMMRNKALLMRQQLAGLYPDLAEIHVTVNDFGCDMEWVMPIVTKQETATEKQPVSA